MRRVSCEERERLQKAVDVMTETLNRDGRIIPEKTYHVILRYLDDRRLRLERGAGCARKPPSRAWLLRRLPFSAEALNSTPRPSGEMLGEPAFDNE
jgi:hypothetical protein